MRKKKKAIDVIEKAKKYSLLAKNYLQKPINVKNRKVLEHYLLNVPANMVIATYGTNYRCIVLLDYTFGELMDIIEERKYLS